MDAPPFQRRQRDRQFLAANPVKEYALGKQPKPALCSPNLIDRFLYRAAIPA